MPSPAEAQATAVTDVVELVRMVELGGIVAHEIRARRVSWTDEEREELDFPLTKSSLATQDNGREFQFRFQIVYVDSDAEYVADYEVVYVTEELVAPDRATLIEFASRVAFMAIYPFLRESIFTSATRLGTSAPILAIVRQGEFSVGEGLSDDDVQATFFDARSQLT